MSGKYTYVEHLIAPVYDENSKILILGSFPSIKSRQQLFFYGHPQNRFWKVIAGVEGCQVPESVEEKKKMLISYKIAVWDVIEKCSIVGSSDNSIRDVRVNDFSKIFDSADIRRIYANGGKAYELYMKYAFEKTGREIIKLPSTSPANAAWNLKKLIDAWSVIRSY